MKGRKVDSNEMVVDETMALSKYLNFSNEFN